ncbi:MAG TPA: ComEA family DNA-binding protein [Firmicutes bacterium]|jgi:competence protein ComEA|nr:ComEA family DNA-binding protein [Bacillota bacterium]
MTDLSGNQKRLVFLLLFAVLLGSAALLYRSWRPGATEVITLDFSGESQAGTPGADWKVVVHLVGAVSQPGVYVMPQGARLYEALKEAGGALDDADLDSLNLAAPVRDGERIYIPFRKEREDLLPPEPVASTKSSSPRHSQTGEDPAPAGQTPAPGLIRPVQGRIDPNTASSAELQSIPGIGPALAERIIADRQLNGRFQTVDDLARVKGIGAKTLDKIRAYLIIEE